MRKYLIYFVLMVILTLTLPCLAAATLYDLKNDWSDSANPNGPWSYNQGVTALPSISNFYPPQPNQPAFAWVQWPGTGHTPIWLKASQDNSMGLDVKLGDVVVHGTDPNNTLGSGAANAVWTSSLAGSVTVTGNVWYASSENRSMDWYLYFNTELLASGMVSYGDAYDRDNPFDFGTFTRSLAAGDVIKFEASAHSGSLPHFVGVNLTIDATPVPVPGAFLLFGSGLVGLAALRRRFEG